VIAFRPHGKALISDRPGFAVLWVDDDADNLLALQAVLEPLNEELMLARSGMDALRLCLEHRDFRLGASRVEEIDRAVTHSRFTVVVFTPAYLNGAFEMYHSLLAAHVSIEVRAPRLLPILRRPCQLVLHARMAEALDMCRDGEVPGALQRLAIALREAPRPRLDRESF